VKARSKASPQSDVLVGEDEAVLADHEAAAGAGPLDLVVPVLFVLGGEPGIDSLADLEIGGERAGLIAAEAMRVRLVEHRTTGLLVEQAPAEADPHGRVAVLAHDIAGRVAHLLRDLASDALR